MDESMPSRQLRRQVDEIGRITRVGQGIEIYDAPLGTGLQSVTDEIRADKAGPSGNKIVLDPHSSENPLPVSPLLFDNLFFLPQPIQERTDNSTELIEAVPFYFHPECFPINAEDLRSPGFLPFCVLQHEADVLLLKLLQGQGLLGEHLELPLSLSNE